MRTVSFTVKKWLVRMLVTIGGMLGFASCQHSGGGTTGSQNSGSASVRGSSSSTILGSSSASVNVNEMSEVEPITCVYGPPPEVVNGVEPVEIEPEPDVYGPPVITEPSEPNNTK